MKRMVLIPLLFIACHQLCNGQAEENNFYRVKQIVDAKYADRTKRDADYKFLRRDEYYMQNRLDENGNMSNVAARRRDLWKQFSKEHVQGGAREYSGNWEFFGPYIVEGNDGIGRVNRIAFHPTDENKIYVGTAGGGLFHTWTHGALWVPLTESLPVNNISGVVIHPVEPDTIYILTGDGDGRNGAASAGYGLQKSSVGVLKSADGGVTWQTTGLVFNEEDKVWPFDLVIHPDFPTILFAATGDGVYRTLDSGDSWQLILEGAYYEFHIKPDQPNIVFALSTESVFRSTTIGLSWDTIPIPFYQDSLKGRMSMAFCAGDPDVMYLAAAPGDSFNFRGLFKSIDAGLTFDLMTQESGLALKQTGYDFTTACNPTDIDEALVGVVSIHKSTDGGSTITPSGGTHADIHDFQVNPLNNRAYVGTDGGLYYSDDFGDTWTFMSEICAITQYYKIAVSQQEANVVIGGTQDNGTNRNVMGATTVFDKIMHSDGMDCAIHPLNDSLMIYSTQDGNFYFSDTRGDGEDSLLHLSSLPEDVRSAWVTPIGWDPANPDVIFLGYDPVYRSFDRGVTFNPIPDTISGRRIMHVTANAERIYASDAYKVGDEVHFRLWSSIDQGDSWTAIHEGNDFPLPTRIISGLCTRPDDPEEVWISLGGWIDQVKVYRSLDGGENWENMSGSLPNTPINTIILDDAPDARVYIGTDIGIFYFEDNLGDWVYFNNGMPIVEVTDLEINYAENKIVAGTYGRGIWWGDLYTACEDVLVVTPIMQRDDHSYFFQASDTLRSAEVMDNSYGIQVIYRSGGAVRLTEGFQAEARYGAIFRALNGECEDGGVPALPLVIPGEAILPVKSKQHPAVQREN